MVEHLFIFEGEGEIKDYNGNYTDYREEKKAETRQLQADNRKASTPSVQVDNRKANDNERKEYKRLEKEIEKLEARKIEIENTFNDITKLSTLDIPKLSKELQDVQNELEIKELRWLELAELV